MSDAQPQNGCSAVPRQMSTALPAGDCWCPSARADNGEEKANCGLKVMEEEKDVEMQQVE